MVKGIIYMYTSPSGKSYIGQTTNEKARKKLWNSSKYHYAGDKIDRARAKYGNNSFVYQVLFTKEFCSKEIAKFWLNVVESYYIQEYNTVEKGYNCEYGGGGNSNHSGAINHHHGGYKLSEETKKRIGLGGKAWMNTPEGKLKMSNARKGIHRKKGYRIEKKFKPVVQLSLSGEFLQEFASIRDASEYINIKNCHVNISNVCKGKRDTANGYRWMYSEDYYKYCVNKNITDVPERVQKMLRNIELKKEKNIIRPSFCKKIVQMDLESNVIHQFDSVKEAADFLKKSRTSISQCLNGKRKSAFGYKWKYLDCA